MIIDFIEPKKVKDILEQVDSSLTDVGLAKLIEKLIYRYDKSCSKKMAEIENNFDKWIEQNNRLIEQAKWLKGEIKQLKEEIKRLEEAKLNAK